jgi:hypothetical protein
VATGLHPITVDANSASLFAVREIRLGSRQLLLTGSDALDLHELNR